MYLFFLTIPLIYALAEIFDSYISQKINSNIEISALMTILSVFTLPLMYSNDLLNYSELKQVIPLLLLIGITNIAYLIPYYKALKFEEVSIISAYFSLLSVITPILSFLFLGENLHIFQYVGIALIILGNVLLSTSWFTRSIKSNKAFFLILIAATILSVEALTIKYISNQNIPWNSILYYQTITSICISLSVILFKRKSIELHKTTKSYKILFLLLLSTIITVLASGLEIYSIEKLPVSIAKTFSLLIPFFIIIILLISKRFYKFIILEKTDTKSIFKKVITYLLVVIGLFLIN